MVHLPLVGGKHPPHGMTPVIVIHQTCMKRFTGLFLFFFVFALLHNLVSVLRKGTMYLPGTFPGYDGVKINQKTKK